MDKSPVLITGSHGLLGSAVRTLLQAEGYEARCLDAAASEPNSKGDILDLDVVSSRLRGCKGVVHLAGVSRVMWGELDPPKCMQLNFHATEQLCRLAADAGCGWFFFASSREVYGNVSNPPVTEDAPLCPINVYGVSKARAEEAVSRRNTPNFKTAIGRFSNVFGSARDHKDRVVPALMQAAMSDGVMRLDDRRSTFDFTFIDDVARGLVALIKRLDDRLDTPPIHFVSGVPTTLARLASMCQAICGVEPREVDAAGRSYDVPTFWGCGARARHLLGWSHEHDLADALAIYRKRLTEEFGR